MAPAQDPKPASAQAVGKKRGTQADVSVIRQRIFGIRDQSRALIATTVPWRFNKQQTDGIIREKCAAVGVKLIAIHWPVVHTNNKAYDPTKSAQDQPQHLGHCFMEFRTHIERDNALALLKDKTQIGEHRVNIAIPEKKEVSRRKAYIVTTWRTDSGRWLGHNIKVPVTCSLHPRQKRPRQTRGHETPAERRKTCGNFSIASTQHVTNATPRTIDEVEKRLLECQSALQNHYPESQLPPSKWVWYFLRCVDDQLDSWKSTFW